MNPSLVLLLLRRALVFLMALASGAAWAGVGAVLGFSFFATLVGLFVAIAALALVGALAADLAGAAGRLTGRRPR